MSLSDESRREIRTLGDISRVHARQRGDKPAIAFEGRTTTFAELDRRTSQVAQALIASGLQPGDRIAHLGKNTDLYFELLLGAAKAGVVMTPVNWRLAPPKRATSSTTATPSCCSSVPSSCGVVEAYTPHARRHARSSAWRRHSGVGRMPSGVMRSGRVIRSWPSLRMRGRAALHIGHDRPSQGRRAGAWQFLGMPSPTCRGAERGATGREPRRDAVLSHRRHGLGDHRSVQRRVERRHARVRSGQSARLHRALADLEAVSRARRLAGRRASPARAADRLLAAEVHAVRRLADAARVVARVHGSVRLRFRAALRHDRDDGFRYGARSRGSRSRRATHE